MKFLVKHMNWRRLPIHWHMSERVKRARAAASSRPASHPSGARTLALARIGEEAQNQAQQEHHALINWD
jgi:hypothetical protein